MFNPKTLLFMSLGKFPFWQNKRNPFLRLSSLYPFFYFYLFNFTTKNVDLLFPRKKKRTEINRNYRNKPNIIQCESKYIYLFIY